MSCLQTVNYSFPGWTLDSEKKAAKGERAVLVIIKSRCPNQKATGRFVFKKNSTKHDSPLSAPCLSMTVGICVEMPVCGSGRTAAIVKVILSPRPTATNWE